MEEYFIGSDSVKPGPVKREIERLRSHDEEATIEILDRLKIIRRTANSKQDVDHLIKTHTWLCPQEGGPKNISLYKVKKIGKNKQQFRIVFTIKGNLMCIAHAFIKKDQKTPKKEINAALKRVKRLQF
ncbi:MAG: type II toxin-antitoxin system RelE/ParE family toxin [Parcubacteria group bacterium]|nr:type II toxin-antitoxin system RelE/ParE family toxin [Parcubacteria group bacterium]